MTSAAHWASLSASGDTIKSLSTPRARGKIFDERP
jgi:hypothetical protein